MTPTGPGSSGESETVLAHTRPRSFDVLSLQEYTTTYRVLELDADIFRNLVSNQERIILLIQDFIIIILVTGPK
jgi:hypothetical protein